MENFRNGNLCNKQKTQLFQDFCLKFVTFYKSNDPYRFLFTLTRLFIGFRSKIQIYAHIEN